MLSLSSLLLLGLAALIVKLALEGLGPLSHLPGPWHTRFSNLSLRLATIKGRRIYHVHSLHQKYGSVVRIAPNEVSVSEISAFSQVHRIGGRFIKSRWYEGTHKGRKPGIFAMRNPDQHAQRRRLFARAFSNTSIAANWETTVREKISFAVKRIQTCASNANEENSLTGKTPAKVSDKKGADLMKWWTLMATDVIAHLAFGESFRMLELERQTAYVDALQGTLLSSLLRSEASIVWHLANWIPIGGLHAITQAEKVVMHYGNKAIHNMRRDGGAVQNLFAQLDAEADKVGSITDDDVKIEAANLIVAGSDTTAVTLTYLIWAVLKQPDLQQNLQDEIASLSEALHLDELTKRAPLLNSIIEETLRLYGAAPGALPRVVPEEGALFGKYQVPGGVDVSTQAFTVHRDPALWTDPLRFDGYRFMNKATMSNEQKTGLHPFGAGSRICIGLHLAWMELRLGAAMFFRHCKDARLAACMSDEMMEFDNRFLIAPKGHCCFVVL